MDVTDIERLIAIIERARGDALHAQSVATSLPATPHWSGTAQYQARFRVEELCQAISRVVDNCDRVAQEARRDLRQAREASYPHSGFGG